MEITEWSDVDFMPPTLMDAHQHHVNNDGSSSSEKALTKLFRKRQEEFYARCMARLKYEGRTWVALVDTDEYIQANPHSLKHNAYLKQQLHSKLEEPSTVLDLLKAKEEQPLNVVNVENNNNDNNNNNKGEDEDSQATLAAKQETKLAQQLQKSPCFPMARLTFGVKESQESELYDQPAATIPWSFDPKDFQTLRWRWHAGRPKKSVNKISKSIIDVSRVDSSLFVPTQQVMVHLPIQEHCHGEDDLWILNSQSLLVVHHYGGTWEQWSRRGSSDPRGKRTREAYETMKYDKQADDTIRPWLAAFCHQVGWWTARRLLSNVGQL
jgi:hypothetical protein